MTYSEVRQRLIAGGVPSPDTEARLLIRSFAGVPEAIQLADRAREYPDASLLPAIARRVAGEPLAYILGQWQFYRQTYEVTPDCLIPREDTELLVTYAVEHLPRGARFCDLCTGSGCVAISTLAERGDTFCDALELYPKTLELARRNAKRNGVEHRFRGIRADVLRGEGVETGTCYSAILSNPPYIPTSVIATLSREVRHEPAAALDGGEDGMLFYRAILDGYRQYLAPGGMFLFEIGYDEGDAIRRLAERHGFGCLVEKDLGGNDRLAILQRD